MPVFSSQLLSKRQLAEGTWEFTFKKPSVFTYQPGQYIWLELDDHQLTKPPASRRPLSLVSISSEPNLRIAVRNSSSWFKQTLVELPLDAEIMIEGPFGSLYFPTDASQPVVCLAGGIGITTFLPLIADSLKQHPDRQIKLLYANHDQQHVAYQVELAEIASKFQQFNLELVTGHLTAEQVHQAAEQYPNADWFFIGPEKMVEAAASLAFTAQISEAKMHFEEFFWSNQTASLPKLEPAQLREGNEGELPQFTSRKCYHLCQLRCGDRHLHQII